MPDSLQSNTSREKIYREFAGLLKDRLVAPRVDDTQKTGASNEASPSLLKLMAKYCHGPLQPVGLLGSTTCCGIRIESEAPSHLPEGAPL